MPVAANPIAVAKFRSRSVVASPLSSEQWQGIDLAIRERAFFSAKVESVRLLQSMQDGIDTALAGVRREGKGLGGGAGAFQGRTRFVQEMQRLGVELGLVPSDPALVGTIQDITSARRLRLIYDFQIESAQEFARWQAGQDPAVLAAFPAQEFVRVASRAKPRINWRERWTEAGGKFFGARMIAAKNADTWQRLSRFGTPCPPFDFNSGMGVRDVRRRDAEALGVLSPGETILPAVRDFNDGLQASVANVSPPLRAELQKTFGDQIAIDGDAAKFQAGAVAEFFDQSQVTSHQSRPLSLGTVPTWGEKLFGGRLSAQLGADAVRASVPGFPSPRIARLAAQALPVLLREPEAVSPTADGAGVQVSMPFLSGALSALFTHAAGVLQLVSYAAAL